MKIKIINALTEPMTEAAIKYIEDSKLLSFTGVDRETEVIYTHFNNVNPLFYPKLKYILCPCTNVSHLASVSVPIINLDDKEFLRDFVWSTAEHTVYLMLSLIKRNNLQLKNSIIGFVGYGRVASQVHRLLSGFNIFPYAYDKDSNIDNLYELFKVADIITVHIEANKETENLVNRECFDKCIKQPLFINTSRGSVVVAQDLIRAYRQGKIKGFALDVMDNYTTTEIEILESFRNGLITRHIGGKSMESRVNTDLFVLKALEDRILEQEKR